MGIFDWKHWLIILLVVGVLFGGKRLRNLGSDLGEAIKGFRRSVTDAEGADSANQANDVDNLPSALPSAMRDRAS